VRTFSLIILIGLLAHLSARAEVKLIVQEENRAASIKYECTGGEVVRAFALNVSVDRGRIVGVSNYFRGESTLTAQGYGIFPAAFRDCITVGNGTNIDWEVPGYTPLAVVGDRPADTLPGLNSSGVTLEFGGLWDPAVPGAVPPATGTLCNLQLSQAANVSVAANLSRGGIIPSSSDITITPAFTGAFVDPAFPAITGLTLTNGVITIHFIGGELIRAEALGGAWVGTGNTNGVHTESVKQGGSAFYRVRHGLAPAFPAITGLTLTNGVIIINFVGGELVSAETLGSGWVGTGQTNGVYVEPVGQAGSKFFRVRQR
jgi:hypothetical protein